jgi:CelD/BcsL family acetyltransferase involved in cellulose biosynthesis
MIPLFFINLLKDGYSVKLTAYDQKSAFHTLEAEWNELLHRSTSDRVFSTWEWQCAWWEAYRPGELWVITCRNETGQLIGIAPWFIETHPVLGRVVRSIGCVEVTDYLDLIVDNQYIDVVLHAFANYAAENHEVFDTIDLCNLPEGAPGQARFPQIMGEYGFEVSLKEQEVCPVIYLPSDWETYLNSLDKKQRHELRRKLRHTEGADEQIDWYIVGKNHNIHQEIQYFLHLMAASHPNKAGFLEDPQNARFFKGIVPITHEKNWLQLSFLVINGERAAAYLNFVYKGRVLVYNSGLLPNQYGHLSPGIVLLAHNIRYAIEAGYSVFDFLRGNEVYKYRMGGQDTRVYMLRANFKVSQETAHV